MTLKKIIILLLPILLISCNDNLVLDEFIEIDSSGWSHQDTVNLEFSIEETDHHYQLRSNLRVSSDFTHTNMQIRLVIMAPDSSLRSHDISIPLADKSGKWLGSGLGSVITFQKDILGLQTFKQKGKYRVIITQNMREDNWPHVHAVGLQVSKDKEIF